MLFRSQAREQAAPWVEAARKRTTAAMGKLEQAFDARVARALQHMNMPSQSDIQELSARVDALAREVRAHARTIKPRTSAKKRAQPKS